MKLYWSQRPNFGDSLNPWIWEKLLPGAFDADNSRLLIGIGSILDHKIPSQSFKLVFGSGFGFGFNRLPNVDPQSWRIYCVRGPVTAAALGLSRDLAIADPAILVRRFALAPHPQPNSIIFMPHFESIDIGEWKTICGIAGVTFVDPRRSIGEVLDALRGAKLVISEAMHGAIVADALRIPWVAARPLVEKNVKKWEDWFGSLGLENRMDMLYPSSVHELLNARYRNLRLQAAKGLHRVGFGSVFADPTPIADVVEIPVKSRSNGKVRGLIRGAIDGVVPTTVRVMPSTLHRKLTQALSRRAAEQLCRLTRAEPRLSSESAIARATERLEEKLEILRADIAGFRDAGRRKTPERND